MFNSVVILLFFIATYSIVFIMGIYTGLLLIFEMLDYQDARLLSEFTKNIE